MIQKPLKTLGSKFGSFSFYDGAKVTLRVAEAAVAVIVLLVLKEWLGFSDSYDTPAFLVVFGVIQGIERLVRDTRKLVVDWWEKDE